MTEGACEASPIQGAQRVAVVLDEPEPMPLAYGDDSCDVEWVPQGVGKHHTPGAGTHGPIQSLHVHVGRTRQHVDEDGHQAELQEGRNGRREAARERDHLVTAHEATVAKPVGHECSDGQEIRRRA